jgi:uncharacterized protein YqjF (DUF2071 family)
MPRATTLAPAAPLRERSAAAFLPVLRQQWRDLLFLHWQVDASALAAQVPPPLALDTRHGAAYVGLVPFEVSATRPPLSALPLAPLFAEVNVRTYVRAPDGERGVWFFSLDAGSGFAAATARAAYRLPYFRARSHLLRRDDTRVFRSQRLAGSGWCAASWRLRPGAAAQAEAGSLEEFLVERYTLFAGRAGALYRARVRHEPYPLTPVKLLALDQDLVAGAGFAVAAAPGWIHHSLGVDVAISAPERL